MKRIAIIVVIAVAALAGVGFYSGVFSRLPAEAAGPNAAGAPGGRAGGGSGGMGGPGGGFGVAFVRPPMTVELGSPSRANVAESITVVGNLVGDATVAVVPRAAGRLEDVYVKLGDRVARGQRIARIEDREYREQVKQAEAAYQVAQATIRQREADLKLAETNAERSRNLFGRQLLPQQSLDDVEARYQAAAAQLDLSRAQFTQSQSRLEELRDNLANTVIVSPVNGFIARRAADPGAFVSQNSPVADVVDIHVVRLVANVVEKDLRRVEAGEAAKVEVDAYPGEIFSGRIARVAPVLDPQTRTAHIEVEIPNPGFRLKPGMYARVSLTIEERANALVVPRNSVVDLEGKRGVFIAKADNTAAFRPIEIGIEEVERIEVVSGVTEQEKIVTTGAAALRDGDRILLPGKGGGAGGPAGGRAGGSGGRGPGQSGQGGRGQTR